jgi:methionyl-tRNA formyltransferase
MRAALLTTDTTHHAYWAWRLREQIDIAAIVIEPDRVSPPFETAHRYEEERDRYEREVLLADVGEGLRELAPAHDVADVNDAEALDVLARAEPDLVVSFGTGLLGPELIASVGAPLLNLHGGNPEEYRGLDTHLWAIYHGDFDNLVTTLHVVDAELDTGAIVGQAQLRFEPGAGLHRLRAVNTEACVDLTLSAALALERLGRVPERAQLRRGRYYSFMPAVLKQRCVERFEKWTSSG